MINPIVKLDVNCPLCGLTRLHKQFCSTCGKHVIFTHEQENLGYTIVETEELIITQDTIPATNYRY